MTTLAVTKTDLTALNFADFVNGVVQTFRFTNDATNRAVKVFCVVSDDKGTEATLSEGKEVFDEGWLLAKLSTDSTWVQIGTPNFPAEFSGTWTGALEFSLTSGQVVDVNFKVIIPAGSSTLGICNFAVKVLSKTT